MTDVRAEIRREAAQAHREAWSLNTADREGWEDENAHNLGMTDAVLAVVATPIRDALDSLDALCRAEDTHGDTIRAHEVRGAVADLRRLVTPVCDLCGEAVIWHEGNGGQWLGAVPPRDWMTCHGSVTGPRHEVRAIIDARLSEAGGPHA